MTLCMICGSLDDQSTYHEKCRRCYNRIYKMNRPWYNKYLNIMRKANYYANRAREIAKTRTYMAQHPERRRCNIAVEKAMLAGTLIRPNNCDNCGITCKPDAHHHDYTMPLQVTWWCRSCHNLWHSDDIGKQIFADKTIRRGDYTRNEN